MVFSDTVLDLFQPKRFKMMVGISKLPFENCPFNIRICLEVCIGIKAVNQHFFLLFAFPKTEYHCTLSFLLPLYKPSSPPTELPALSV